MGSPLHLTEVREAESRMALIFLKTVTLTGRARRAPPEDRDSTHVGNLDCQILSGGDLILSHHGIAVVDADAGSHTNGRRGSSNIYGRPPPVAAAAAAAARARAHAWATAFLGLSRQHGPARG